MPVVHETSLSQLLHFTWMNLLGYFLKKKKKTAYTLLFCQERVRKNCSTVSMRTFECFVLSFGSFSVASLFRLPENSRTTFMYAFVHVSFSGVRDLRRIASIYVKFNVWIMACRIMWDQKKDWKLRRFSKRGGEKKKIK